jgi:hypothetical protein
MAAVPYICLSQQSGCKRGRNRHAKKCGPAQHRCRQRTAGKQLEIGDEPISFLVPVRAVISRREDVSFPDAA